MVVEKLVGMIGRQGVTMKTRNELRLRVEQTKKMERQIGDLAMLAMIDDDFWRLDKGDGSSCIVFNREERRVILWNIPIEETVDFWGPPKGDRSEIVFEGVLNRPEIVRWNNLRDGEVTTSYNLRDESVFFGEKPFDEMAEWSGVVDKVLDSVPEYKEIVVRGRKSVERWNKK